MKTKFTRALISFIVLIFAIKGARAQQQLIHFWDYNQTQPSSGSGGDSLGTELSYSNPILAASKNSYPLPASYTRIPSGNPKIVWLRPSAKQPSATTYDSIIDNGGGGSFYYDYSGYNYNYFNTSDSTGSAGNLFVRSRNPTENAYLYMYAPTTGWKNINFYFALTASSTKGAKFFVFSYSKDGGVTWNKLTAAMDTFNVGGKAYPDSLQAINPTTAASIWYPVHIDFSSDAGVNNNPNFILRWQFVGAGSSGNSGNNRFDNFSILGDSNTSGIVSYINTRNNAGPCYGDSNGSARVYVTGGTAPYTYSWSSNATNSKSAGGLATDSAYGLKAGTYTVTVTDLNDNASYAYVTILQPIQVVPTIIAQTNISCNGSATGSVTTLTSGGSTPYTYSWSNGNTSGNITGLTAGSYTLTVTDKKGCTGSVSVTITQPTAITVSTSSSPVTCSGPGSASATPSGGTPYKVGSSYTYLWSNGATTATASGLGTGTYTITVTDSLGCTGTATATVGTSGATIVLTSIPVTCYGGNNGSIISSVSGGVTPYTYNWSTGATTTSITGLTAGSYTLTVTEGNGCVTSSIANVIEPAVLKDTVVSVTPAVRLIHYWDLNTTKPASGAGGDSLGTEISYSNPSFAATKNSFPMYAEFSTIPSANPKLEYIHPSTTTSLVDNGAGSPYAYVNDLHANGNDTASSAAGNLFIRNRNPVKNSTFYWYLPTTGYQNVTLDWALSASSTKGAQYLLISYSTDGGTTWKKFTTAMDTFNIGGKFYPDTILAINSITSSSNWYPCHIDFSTDPATNNNPNLIFRINYGGSNVTLTSGNNRYDNISLKGSEIPKVSCNGSNNGSGAAMVTGGTAPYTYTWSTGATGDTATNLNPGINTVTVTDKNGCTVTASINVVNPPALKDSMSVFNGCHNSNNGTVTSIPSGGTGPYSWSWSTGSTSNIVSSLSAGTYTVTVTDVHGCSVTASAAVTNPAQLTLSINSTNVTCNGNNDGMANGAPSGGTGPYTYKWSLGAGGSTKDSVTGLNPGLDSLMVTDANGCTASATVTITQPTQLRDSISSFVNVACNGDNSGSATAGVIGGTTPYTYSWSNGATNATANNLTAGTYTLTVADANNCSMTASVSLTEPTALSNTTSSTQSACGSNTGSATINVSGGTPGYTYSWNNGGTTATINSLSAGTYNVTVTDNNSCTMTASVMVNNVNGPHDSIASFTNNMRFGGNIGTATVGVTGGTPGYTYSWSTIPAQTNPTATGLTAGSYTVTVTDAAGCISTTTATLSDPAQLRDSITSTTNPVCNGVGSGQATVGVAGGASPYSYSWTSGANAATATGLTAGSYTVTVSDNNGCSASASVTLTEPPAFIDSVTGFSNGCIGQNNGMATVSVGGATPPYTYSWAPGGQTTTTVSGLSAGTYTVDVFDQHACALVVLVHITPDSIPVVKFNVGSDSVECDTVPSVSLASLVSPTGGSFTGTGISGNNFMPSVTGNGTFRITYHYTNGGGCADSASQNIRVDSCKTTGIAQLLEAGAKISIYPNPSYGQFTISGLSKGSTIQLFNDIGMLIQTARTDDETVQLNIVNLPNGMYMVRIIRDDGGTLKEQKILKID